MVSRTGEQHFEEDIEQSLLSQPGYEKGTIVGFDYEYGINIPEVITYVQETQPSAWKRYSVIYADNPEEAFIKRLDKVIKTDGLVNVLRRGFKDRGVKFNIVSFKNETTLNADVTERYNKNRLKVIRQFKYSNRHNNTIDLVIQLNGIPIVGLELKDQFTGQNVDDAMNQWRKDRNKSEKVFQFNQRFLVYFAVDLSRVYMTTKLENKDTYFLPFNQGSNGPGNDGGAGNPEYETDYSTSYLWNYVLTKDTLLDIIQRYIHIKGGPRDGALIFPRYHQLDVVTNMVESARLMGPGSNYLIQHSAGSGKSYSIAWLAYRLSSLHNMENEPVFNSVIVVTDRRVLDRQLQDTIYGLDHTEGVVEKIDEKKSSQDLKQAIEDEKKIIISTIQKFPVIYEEIKNQSGKNFAVLIDEAHSGQSGQTAQKLRGTLGDIDSVLEEAAEYEITQEKETEDTEDRLNRELAEQGDQQNLSTFAFTATPKMKTIEMFGQKQEDGSYKAHHIYSMRQAIEEGFILDVLENYMTYETSYKIAKNIDENPEMPESETVKLIQRFGSLHPHNLRQKTAIMVRHMMDVTRHKINGKGKAMLVTASRLHAVRYFHEFQQYIKDHGLEDELGVLVAFSGTVEDRGLEYTESQLNTKRDGSHVSESQLPAEFATDEFNALVVAEKYQTGFDEPLLHTMFVDKKLRGVKAVQTLSRLNRVTKDKEETFVLDFVNTAEDIQEAFEPYYRETELASGTDPNLIYDLQSKVHSYNLYSYSDVENFSKVYYSNDKETNQGQLESALKSIVRHYADLEEDQQYEFRTIIRKFIKFYNYLTQLVRFFDQELHKDYIFCKFLEPLLKARPENSEDVDIADKIELEFYKLEQTFAGNISLNDADPMEPAKNINPASKKEEEKELLDVIIERVNAGYDGDFTKNDRVLVENLVDEIAEDDAIYETAKNNTEKVFMDSVLNKEFEQVTMNKYLEDQETYEKLFKNPEFYKAMKVIVARTIYSRAQKK